MLEALPHDAEDQVRVFETPGLVVGAWQSRDELADVGAFASILAGQACGQDGSTINPPAISAAWRREGRDALVEWNGSYTAALWTDDGGKFTALRDHFGSRPLFYHRSSARLAVATEIPPLLALPGVSRDIDQRRVAEHLVMEIEEAEGTLFAAVRRVPAGSYLEVQDGDVRIERYWYPGSHPAVDLEPTECASMFRTALDRAVARRTQDGRVAVCLSGGLDSSSLAALIATGTEDPVAITARYPRAVLSDESRYAKAVLAMHPALRPHSVFPGEHAPLFQPPVPRGQEPIWNPQYALHGSVANAALEMGYSAVIDGSGGDEVVGYGLLRLVELARSARLPTLARELSQLTDVTGGPARSYVREVVLPGTLPEGLRPLIRAMRRPITLWAPHALPLEPGFARRINADEWRRARLTRPLDRTAAGQLKNYFLSARMPFVLEQAHALGQAKGVDFRFPFLDRDLLELSIALPSSTKLRNGWTRWILREAIKDLLPSEIAWRPDKGSLTHAFVVSLRGAGFPWVLDHTVTNPGHLGEFLQLDKVATMTDAFARDGDPHLGFSLWRAACMSAFLRANC